MSELRNQPDWQRTGRPHVWMPYTQMRTAPIPLPVVATEGVNLVLADGRKLIDGMSSWWTACHGYNHPHIVEAMESQLRRMPHVMFGGLQHEPALTLARRLAELLPGDLNRVFFSDSGSVAVEVALKMALQFWRNRGQTSRRRFISFEHAYHGDTTGAMSLCDPAEGMHARFRGLLPEQFSLPLPRTPDEADRFDDAVRSRREELAGVFLEPLIQAAGGMKFHGPETVRWIRASCDRHDVLLIADEVATGFGRAGSMFAIDQAEVVPDILCLGKALTGGALGTAATVATGCVFDAFLTDDPADALMHGPTFMANPLACAAANASLDLFESEPRIERAQEMQREMDAAIQSCRDLPGVVDVRCRGAVGVVQVEELRDLDRLRNDFVNAGVWVRPFADIIYLAPPLSISRDELRRLCEAFVNVVTGWTEG